MSFSLGSESNLSEEDLLCPDDFNIHISKPLALKFGLESAVILGYFHAVLQNPTCVIDEVPWIEKTYVELTEEIKCVGESAIRRRIKKLEAEGLLKSRRLSKKQYRQSKSYTICYDAVEKITQA